MTAPPLFPPDLIEDARRLIDAARSRGLKLATAESCTGGLIAATLTEIPGASDVVERSFVTYSNAAKVGMINVDLELIRRHGAVSAEVARAMAEGALYASAASLAVSATGIAGPGGATPGKPVGLVFVAAARTGRPAAVRECRFGDMGRTAVRLASVRAAFQLLDEAMGP
jgi:nicotinamide-nucleotide amidase